MKKVTITYTHFKYMGGKIEFTANELFYKNELGYRFIGYYPEGKHRKKWFPIGGKKDDINDYTDTIVNIQEAE